MARAAHEQPVRNLPTLREGKASVASLTVTRAKADARAREMLEQHGLEVTGTGGFLYRANVAIGPALLAAMEQYAADKVAEERERCARVAADPHNGLSAWRTRERIAATIRGADA